MGSNKTSKLLRSMIPKRTKTANNSFTGALVLPNNSGDHQKGYKRQEPTLDYDITNKKYVDDQIAGVGGWTDTSTNTGTNKTLNSSTNDIHADSIHELLRNETGSDINRGDAVYISGYNVGLERALVTLADSTSSATMPSVALVEDETITNNATGEFIEAGTLIDVKTDDWSVGDALWVSETGTTGNTLTNTKPTGTTEIQKVGEVLRSHATRGIIEVFGAGRVNDLPNVATHPMSMGSNKITSVTDPTANQDVSTKKYVDDNLHAKQHSINDAANHTSPLDPGQMIMANVITGLPNNATNTNVQVAGAVNHSTGDGSDHADVATNTAASHSNATDHNGGTQDTAIALNTTHRGSNGSEHSDVAANTAAKHDEAHSIVSHNDTTATGAELDSLTDNSMVDTKHRHSELSASDGTPDKALSLGATGIMSMTNQSRFSAGRSITQPINNTTFTTVFFNIIKFDTQGEYSFASGIFTADEAGYYLFTWSIIMAQTAWTVGELYYSKLVTTSDTFHAGRQEAWASNSAYLNTQGTAIAYLTAGQTAKVQVWQQSGGTINIHPDVTHTYFMGHKLS